MIFSPSEQKIPVTVGSAGYMNIDAKYKHDTNHDYNKHLKSYINEDYAKTDADIYTYLNEHIKHDCSGNINVDDYEDSKKFKLMETVKNVLNTSESKTDTITINNYKTQFDQIKKDINGLNTEFTQLNNTLKHRINALKYIYHNYKPIITSNAADQPKLLEDISPIIVFYTHQTGDINNFKSKLSNYITVSDKTFNANINILINANKLGVRGAHSTIKNILIEGINLLNKNYCIYLKFYKILNNDINHAKNIIIKSKYNEYSDIKDLKNVDQNIENRNERVTKLLDMYYDFNYYNRILKQFNDINPRLTEDVIELESLNKSKFLPVLLKDIEAFFKENDIQNTDNNNTSLTTKITTYIDKLKFYMKDIETDITNYTAKTYKPEDDINGFKNLETRLEELKKQLSDAGDALLIGNLIAFVKDEIDNLININEINIISNGLNNDNVLNNGNDLNNGNVTKHYIDSYSDEDESDEGESDEGESDVISTIIKAEIQKDEDAQNAQNVQNAENALQVKNQLENQIVISTIIKDEIQKAQVHAQQQLQLQPVPNQLENQIVTSTIIKDEIQKAQLPVQQVPLPPVPNQLENQIVISTIINDEIQNVNAQNVNARDEKDINQCKVIAQNATKGNGVKSSTAAAVVTTTNGNDIKQFCDYQVQYDDETKVPEIVRTEMSKS